MSYTVIFSSVHDISSYITDDNRVDVLRSLQKYCGLHYKHKRPDKIIVYEDNIIDRLLNLKYREWLIKSVIPCGANDCKYIYVSNVTTYEFTRKQFYEFIRGDSIWQY